VWNVSIKTTAFGTLLLGILILGTSCHTTAVSPEPEMLELKGDLRVHAMWHGHPTHDHDLEGRATWQKTRWYHSHDLKSQNLNIWSYLMILAKLY
jgi:hypothetical protein